MPELPMISGDKAIKAFIELGFYKARQKGRHVVMRKDNKGCDIPKHKALAVGTLRNAIRQAGVTIEDFIAACK